MKQNTEAWKWWVCSKVHFMKMSDTMLSRMYVLIHGGSILQLIPK